MQKFMEILLKFDEILTKFWEGGRRSQQPLAAKAESDAAVLAKDIAALDADVSLTLLRVLP